MKDCAVINPVPVGKFNLSVLLVPRPCCSPGYLVAPVEVRVKLPRRFVSEGDDVESAYSLEVGVNVAFIV